MSVAETLEAAVAARRDAEGTGGNGAAVVISDVDEFIQQLPEKYKYSYRRQGIKAVRWTTAEDSHRTGDPEKSSDIFLNWYHISSLTVKMNGHNRFCPLCDMFFYFLR
jgi:hypothetical protein